MEELLCKADEKQTLNLPRFGLRFIFISGEIDAGGAHRGGLGLDQCKYL